MRGHCQLYIINYAVAIFRPEDVIVRTVRIIWFLLAQPFGGAQKWVLIYWESFDAKGSLFSGHTYWVVFLAMAGRFGISAVYSIVTLHTAELFPTEIRSSALGTSSTWSHVGSISAPYVVDFLVCTYSRLSTSNAMGNITLIDFLLLQGSNILVHSNNNLWYFNCGRWSTDINTSRNPCQTTQRSCLSYLILRFTYS